jgi:hypothetical protein
MKPNLSSATRQGPSGPAPSGALDDRRRAGHRDAVGDQPWEISLEARRVVAHEVGHDLGLSDDRSADTTNLMNIRTPPGGGVVLDSGQCTAVRTEAATLAVPPAKAGELEL